MIPIILSQARAQSKEAQRTGSSIPGKGCTATLILGDPNSVKQQVTRTSLASSPPSPPCSGPNSQPPPRIGSTRHPPDPRLQTPDLPTIPGTPARALTASVTATSLEAQSLLSEPSPRGVPPAPNRRVPGAGQRDARGREARYDPAAGTCSEPGGAPGAREPPSPRAGPERNYERDARPGAWQGHTTHIPKCRTARGFLTPGKSSRKLPGKGPARRGNAGGRPDSEKVSAN